MPRLEDLSGHGLVDPPPWGFHEASARGLSLRRRRHATQGAMLAALVALAVVALQPGTLGRSSLREMPATGPRPDRATPVMPVPTGQPVGRTTPAGPGVTSYGSPGLGAAGHQVPPSPAPSSQPSTGSDHLQGDATGATLEGHPPAGTLTRTATTDGGQCTGVYVNTAVASRCQDNALYLVSSATPRVQQFHLVACTYSSAHRTLNFPSEKQVVFSVRDGNGHAYWTWRPAAPYAERPLRLSVARSANDTTCFDWRTDWPYVTDSGTTLPAGHYVLHADFFDTNNSRVAGNDTPFPG